MGSRPILMLVCRVLSRYQRLDSKLLGVVLGLDLHFWEEAIDDDPKTTI